MKKLGNWVRRVLYNTLPLNAYLSVLSKLYFISFNLGLLKNNKVYQYPYFLHHVIRKGDICLDIGANLGYMSTLFSKLVGPKGKVYSVEPVEPILKVLRKNTKGMSNIEILPYALGEENKTIHLGNNTIQKKGYMATGSISVIEKDTDIDFSCEAEMKKGSELFADLERIDFIKCDIEGYESIVLPEMKSVISKHRPVVLIESRVEIRKLLLEFFNGLKFNG
ncbi:MAG: FkbM family methyltransferase, partial [Saprospiraceae bacterium]|nr:FkbM family methyltransferase [Saprospiraceae bacterium]